MNIFLLIFLVFLIVLIILFLRFYTTKNDKNREKYFKTIEIILLSFIPVFGLFISNEVIQPIFSPQIRDLEIKPLFIQSQESDTKDLIYYTVFEAKYKVALPLFSIFPKSKEIDLKLPGKEDRALDLDVIISFQENSPYYKINLPEKELYGSFLNYQKINSKIPIKILSDADEIKEVDIKIIFRERTEMDFSSPRYSMPYWWTVNTVYPIGNDKEIVKWGYNNLLGYGKWKPFNNYYAFYDFKIQSATDLKIKGLGINVQDEYEFCDGEIKLFKSYGRISIDLEPREIKHILVLNRIENQDIISDKDFKFDFESQSECIGQFVKYKELMGELV